MMSNWGYERLASHTRAESIDEMRHAEQVIERILFLEGNPNMQRLSPIRVGENVPEQFQVDVELEYAAIKRLNDGIATCVTLGDNATRELLEGILVSEEEHTDWLETQLGLVAALGETAYLAEQLYDSDAPPAARLRRRLLAAGDSRAETAGRRADHGSRRDEDAGAGERADARRAGRRSRRWSCRRVTTAVTTPLRPGWMDDSSRKSSRPGANSSSSGMRDTVKRSPTTRSASGDGVGGLRRSEPGMGLPCGQVVGSPSTRFMASSTGVGDDVLPPTGLVVGVGPRQAEDVGEEALGQAVAAHDALGQARGRRR